MIRIDFDTDKLRENIKNIPDSVRKELQKYFEMTTKEMTECIDNKLLENKIIGEFREATTVGELKEILKSFPDDMCVYDSDFNDSTPVPTYWRGKTELYLLSCHVVPEKEKNKLCKILNNWLK